MKINKYTRTEIKHYNQYSFCVTEEILNKWVCQVFINCLHPEYTKLINNNEDDFVCILIGDTWQEVNDKFNKMNEEEGV